VVVPVVVVAMPLVAVVVSCEPSTQIST